MGNHESFSNNHNNYVTLYSISNSDYMEWQADLLDESFKRVGMPGTLYRLVSQDLDYPTRPLGTSNIAQIITTPSYAKLPTRIYTPMNKPGSLLEFLRQTDIPENTIMIFVDPDMIFTKQWLPQPKVGSVVGQRWKGYNIEYCKQTQYYCPQTEQEAIMYPFSIRLSDARKMAQNYYKFSAKQSEDWMVEMSALVAAILSVGLKIETYESIGLCNDWNNNNDERAPIIHYTQGVRDINGTEIWTKRRHLKGTKVPSSSLATNRVDRIILELLR